MTPAPPSAPSARHTLDAYLRAMVEKRYADLWQLLAARRQQTEPRDAYLASKQRVPAGDVAPQGVVECHEADGRARAVVVALCSLPIDPLHELQHLEAAGQGDSVGARKLRATSARWDGSHEWRARVVELGLEAGEWRVDADNPDGALTDSAQQRIREQINARRATAGLAPVP